MVQKRGRTAAVQWYAYEAPLTATACVLNPGPKSSPILGARRALGTELATVVALVLFLAAGATVAAFAPPERITVVTDFDYPPYLFTSDDGELKGIVRDKWRRWSEKTGIPAEVKGKPGSTRSARFSRASMTSSRRCRTRPIARALYEYSQPYAPVEANVYFHRSISAISDVASMRGFTIGAKRGSACGDWLSERGIALREYPRSEALVNAAGSGEVRLFCMDSMTARYYLYKLQLADDFRASPPLYATQFHWAVKKGRTELLAFIQQGFDKFSPNELEDIDNRWVGNPIEFPIATRFLYYLAIVAEIVLVLYLVLVIWNRMLRKRVAARTDELGSALGSLRQAVGAGNVGLFDWDLRTNRVRYSPEWKRQIGYDDAEISDAYSEWHDRLHPDDRERVLAAMRGCIDSPPHECRVQFRFRHKDGSYRWILAQAGAQLDAHGKVSKMLGSHVDITDQKRNEALVAGQAQVHELVAKGAPLEQSLDSLLRVVEAQSSGMLGSILLLDADGTHVHHLAAPSLPARILSRDRRRSDRRRRRIVRHRHVSTRTGDRRRYRQRSAVVRLPRNCAAPRIAGRVVDADLRCGQQGPRIVRAVLHRTAPPIGISPATDCDGDALRSDRDQQTSRAACADRGRRTAATGHYRREPRHLASRHVHSATCTARMHASHFAGLRRARRSRPHGSSKCCIPLTAMLRTPLCAAR